MNTQTPTLTYRVSEMAEALQGSEIIKLAGEVKELIAQGKPIHNLTIGDFDPAVFPIPEALLHCIKDAYDAGHTNYPAANGVEPLRRAIAEQVIAKMGMTYRADDILIAGGARPLIYATFQALVDPGDYVVFPVPSWNNNHYTHLTHAKPIFVETSATNNFMPTVDDVRPYIQKARLVAVCSPLNPTGTVFSREQLLGICELIVSENRRRGADEKPVFLMFDQIYWQLTLSDVTHEHPINLCPEIAPYVVYIDGLSKAFAATGVRVGWGFGPSHIISKMKSILGHVGAWAPKAEQIACAEFLNQTEEVEKYLVWIKAEINARLEGLYTGFNALKNAGLPIDVIPPQGAIYLTLNIDLTGKRTADGTVLNSTEDTTRFLLNEAHLAVVPFYAFGASKDSTWYRLSVGTVEKKDIPAIVEAMKTALETLS
jgi:aspartate aminotransferase